jgi:protein gp37
MGVETAIEWCHHTHNIVWGCEKVSPACKHCYAETFSKRVGLQVWGAQAPRRVMSESYWKQPVKWNAAAQKAGERRRVFCSSMADVFEDHVTVAEQRLRLWPLIEATPWLDWLLLTKRPQHIASMLPATWLDAPRPNVWLGTTCESQEWAEKRVPVLLEVPAAVRFLSAEPLLGPVDIYKWLDPLHKGGPREPVKPRIDWVIVGGESGPGARPMHPMWARDVRQQCEEARTPFLFKQWGDWLPKSQANGAKCPAGWGTVVADGQFFSTATPFNGHDDDGTGEAMVYRLGKKVAGRLLDGVQHDGYPVSAA